MILPRRSIPARFGVAPLLAIASLFLSLSASAAQWFVAVTGNDANAGSLAAPFATIQRAQTAAASGDTVFVRGGTYNTFAIFATDANYNYVHRLNKGGVTWSAYPGETPIFDFSSVPTNLRVCGFHVTGTNVTIIGFVVTGVKDGTQKQSECFRIDGSSAIADFVDCVAHDNAANGFYFTNHARGSCTRCDSYNNIGTNSDSIGNTDGFGAHGNGVTFRYCRAWNNSDDGYDCISSDGANTFDHCWAYNMRAGGDSNGFKVGGYGSGSVPGTVPAHTVTYCLSANNNAHGFYANHQPAKAADWLHNSAYNHSAGNFDMLERQSTTDATDIPGFREVLHFNVSFAGTIIKDDNNPASAVTENSWTKPGVTVTAADFLSVDAAQMIAPRSAGNNMPFITFMHLASDSDLVGLGCFDPPPPAPANVQAAWVNSGRVDVAWTTAPGATEYYVRRATTPGGPYTNLGVRLTGTSFSDTTAAGGTTYYYQVYSMNGVSYDAGFSAEAVATIPPVAVTAIAVDSGRSTTDAVTNDPTLILSGTALPGSVVTLSRVGVGNLGTTTANGSGAWSFDYTGTTLANGTHSFQATAGGFTSDPLAVTVDTVAPAAPAIASVSGNGGITVSGTGEAVGLVAVSVDGTPLGTTITDANGSWVVASGGSLSPAVHTFLATTTDVAGNTGAGSTPFVLDASVPAPTIAAAQTDFGAVGNGGLTRDKTISLTGSAAAGSTVTVTRTGTGPIGTAIADGGGAWSLDYTAVALPEGATTFSATASSGGANSLSSPAFTLNVDSVAPFAVSIVRQNPTTATVTSAVTSLVYRVTFSEAVGGVDPGDFALTTTGGASGTIATVSAATGAVIDVTVNNLAGAGTLRLDLKSAGTGVADAAGNACGGFTAGETYTRVISSTGNGTWTQVASGGLWSDPGNWLNAVIPSASTNSANFATLDLTTTNIVHLDSARTINSATFGDTDASTPGNWYLDNNGLAANTLTLAGTTPTITVNALGTDATATIGARVAGTGGLVKGGAGTLVFTAANTLSGALNVSAGAVRAGFGSSLAHSTLTIGTGAMFDLDGGTFSATGNTTLGGTSTLLVEDGTATLAAVNFGTSDGGTFRVESGTVNAASVTIPRSTDSTIRYTTGFVVVGGATTISGAVSLGTGNSNGVMSVEGGALTVNGIVTVGNQATATRGGAMRVIGGTFTSTNTASGIVLSRTNGSNANNVSFATFSGGVSTVEKLTLGFDSTVTAGAATITVDGGTLYVGSGGIVKNGTAGMTTNINLSAGTLGAKAAWSTTVPIALPAGGNVSLKAASAANAPFNISLNGAVSGAGGLTKVGGGTLTLDGTSITHSYTGPTIVNEGALRVTSALGAATNAVTINAGAALTGNGTINRPIALNAGGAIAPDGATAIATLTGTSLTWSGGGALAFDLGATSDKLALSGAFTRAGSGPYVFNFAPAAGYALGNVYSLVSFGSTNFAASDFTATGFPAGTTGVFAIVGNELRLTIVGPPTVARASAGGTYNVPFNFAIAATNLPTSYAASDLPPGLAVDPLTGAIAGTPSAAGDFNATIFATNGAGTGSAALKVSIAQAHADVAVGNLGATYNGAPHAVSVLTTPPNLGVLVTYDGHTAAPVNAATYPVIVTVVDANYAGSGGGSLVIAPADQTIAFPNPGPKTYGDAAFPLGASASSGLAVSYAVVSGPATLNGNVVTLTGAGSVTLRATQAGDNNYHAAPAVEVTFAADKATANVALSDLDATYDGHPHAATASTTPANLTVLLTYEGDSAAPTNAGSYAVVATIDEPNYRGTATGTLTIAKASQSIAFANPGAKTYGDAAFALTANATSGLPVSFAVVSGGANVSGSTLTITGAGDVTVRASQGGNANFNPAPDVDVTFNVAKNGTTTITLDGLFAVYDGASHPGTATTTPAGLTVTFTYNGTASAPVYPGSYTVVATIDDPNYSGTTTSRLNLVATAQVRHAPTLVGDLDGSVQMLLGENLAVTGNAVVSGDLLVPGTPDLQLNGHPTLVDTRVGPGDAAPTNYVVTLSGTSMVRYLVRAVTPTDLASATAPDAPAGTRSVTLNSASQNAGDFTTVRDLTLNGNAGDVVVPPGAYRNLTANGSAGFVLGVAGATEPAVYHVQRLTMNGSGRIQVRGPVILRLASDLAVRSDAGAAAQPQWLAVELASGNVSIAGGATLHAIVSAPNGTVTVNGGGTLRGRVSSDRLFIAGGGALDGN